MATKTEQAKAGIKAVLAQGGDPRDSRKGLAAIYGLSLDEIDALIAEAGAPYRVAAEDAAAAVLRIDRESARRDPSAYRRSQNEEE